MNNLTRLPVKWVRDYIKKDYKLRDYCYICNSTSALELHHLYSVSELFNTWCSKNKINNISSDEQIIDLRVQFAEDNKEYLGNDNLYTLCSNHHKRLHNIYGQRYANSMVPKVKNWLETQKVKNKSL
jgi:5-methylcytosine-specific restriction endonuclease McrA